MQVKSHKLIRSNGLQKLNLKLLNCRSLPREIDSKFRACTEKERMNIRSDSRERGGGGVKYEERESERWGELQDEGFGLKPVREILRLVGGSDFWFVSSLCGIGERVYVSDMALYLRPWTRGHSFEKARRRLGRLSRATSSPSCPCWVESERWPLDHFAIDFTWIFSFNFFRLLILVWRNKESKIFLACLIWPLDLI